LECSTPAADVRVSTLAGSGVAGAADADGTAARFSIPFGIAIGPSGSLYVTDTGNHTLRKVTPDGKVTTLAGKAGSLGNLDGSGENARFNYPEAIVVDADENLFVCDTYNQAIRKVSPAGEVITIAGGNQGDSDGQGTNAGFSFPVGIAVDGKGNLYVTDTLNSTVRKITPAGGVITLAGKAGAPGQSDGTGGDARFDWPQGIVSDSAGNLWVSDTYNHSIRKITPDGVVSTFAGQPGAYGTNDATGLEAHFYHPTGLALDKSGKLLVADTYNETIRMVTSDAVVTTLAGNPLVSGTNNGTGPKALFRDPSAIAASPSGSFYVADTGNHMIRAGALPPPIQLIVAQQEGKILISFSGFPGDVYGLLHATNCSDWNLLYKVTNVTGNITISEPMSGWSTRFFRLLLGGPGLP